MSAAWLATRLGERRCVRLARTAGRPLGDVYLSVPDDWWWPRQPSPVPLPPSEAGKLTAASALRGTVRSSKFVPQP